MASGGAALAAASARGALPAAKRAESEGAQPEEPSSEATATLMTDGVAPRAGGPRSCASVDSAVAGGASASEELECAIGSGARQILDALGLVEARANALLPGPA